MSEAWEILENPLLKEINAQKRLAVTRAIPQCPEEAGRYVLSLWQYLSATPQRFYDRQVHTAYLDWLTQRCSDDRPALKSYLSENIEQIGNALSHLEEVNRLSWHDANRKRDEISAIRFIDQNLNPVYLRLIEAVLYPLIRVVAYFSRLDRNKSTDGLEVRPVFEEVRGGTLECAVLGYRHIVRNGIGHGGVSFLENSISYRDKKGNEETFDASSISRLFDDVLDSCNGLALGIHTFLLSQHPDEFARPRSLLLQELKEETKLLWWNVDGCLPTTRSNSSQLIIYAEATTSDIDKVRFSVFHTAILAEQFAPGYSRYFVSIRSKWALPGFAAFDGTKLADLRAQPGSTLNDYGDVLENRLLFFVPRYKVLRVFRRLETFIAAAKYHILATAMKRESRFSIEARGATVHRNSWGAVLTGSVVLASSCEEIHKSDVVDCCSRILSRALSEARNQLPWHSVERYLPLGYAKISLFRKNYRRRRLEGFGLGEDLICTVQVQRISRIKSPDIFGSTVEAYGKYRIAWNRAWLSAGGAQQIVAADI